MPATSYLLVLLFLVGVEVVLISNVVILLWGELPRRFVRRKATGTQKLLGCLAWLLIVLLFVNLLSLVLSSFHANAQGHVLTRSEAEGK